MITQSDPDRGVTKLARLLSAASRVLEGDESRMAAQELEGVLLDEYLDDEWASSLQEGLALYAPGSGAPYLDAPELRQLILAALGVLARESGLLASTADAQQQHLSDLGVPGLSGLDGA